MSAPTRFLVLAVFSWIGIRATAGVLDLGPVALADLQPSTSLPPQTGPEFGFPMSMPEQGSASLPPGYGYYPAIAAYSADPAGYPYPPAAAGSPWPVQRFPAPVYYPYPLYQAAMPQPTPSAPARFEAPAELDFSGFGQGEESPLSRLVAGMPRAQTPIPSFTGKPKGGFDRLSLSSWALVRQEKPVLDLTGPRPVLATGGTLGGSQAGARLTWRFNRALALNLRVSAPIGQQQLQQNGRRFSGEAALGVSWQPLQSVPVRLMAERRKAIGVPGGGRDGFALLAEGGVYGRALPWRFQLDGYAQTGVVGARTREWFVDGGATVTRPLMRRFAIGAGIWGGAQPGLSRLDIGPRLSMQVRPGIRTHLDYRYRLFGSAQPGSGFAATVATDF